VNNFDTELSPCGKLFIRFNQVHNRVISVCVEQSTLVMPFSQNVPSLGADLHNRVVVDARPLFGFRDSNDLQSMLSNQLFICAKN
jgi:hypothetical protein